MRLPLEIRRHGILGATLDVNRTCAVGVVGGASDRLILLPVNRCPVEESEEKEFAKLTSTDDMDVMFENVGFVLPSI